jgi:hypothetical protein
MALVRCPGSKAGAVRLGPFAQVRLYPAAQDQGAAGSRHLPTSASSGQMWGTRQHARVGNSAKNTREVLRCAQDDNQEKNESAVTWRLARFVQDPFDAHLATLSACSGQALTAFGARSGQDGEGIRRGFGGVEVGVDLLGGFGGDYGGERIKVGGGDAAQAAEVLEEALAGARADAGDGEEFRIAVAHLAALAVIGDGEAVRLVANALDEMQDRGAAVEDDGLVLLAVEVDDFFSFRDGGEGLGGQPEGFERGGGGVELADSAVDED